jgi:outer membrane protein
LATTFNRTIGALAIGLGLLALGAASTARAQGGPGRVGFVSIERLYVESKVAKAADARLQAEFSGRAKASQELFARLKGLSDAYETDEPNLLGAELIRRRREVEDLEKEARRAQTAYREDLLQRTGQERESIAARAQALSGQVAQQDKIDIVLFRDVLWMRPGIDITDKIIRQLDQ